MISNISASEPIARLRHFLSALEVVAACFFLCIFSTQAFAYTSMVYVSPAGDDSASGATNVAGSHTGPVATVSQALARVRDLRSKHPEEQFRIEILPGTYRVAKPIELGPNDSGTESSPLIIEGTTKSPVILSGSLSLSKAGRGNDQVLSRVQASVRSRVLAFNLKENGITEWVGPVERGVGITDNTSKFPSELILDGQPLADTSWPKGGFTKLKIQAGDQQTFQLQDPLPKPWETISNLWAYGYWGNDWADAKLPIQYLGSGKFGFKGRRPLYTAVSGQRVMIMNFPEAIDAPGDWYFDDSEGVIYFLPPTRSYSLELSNVGNIINVNQAKNILIQNLTMENSRQGLIKAMFVKNFVIDHCLLRNTGATAATIVGVDSGIKNSILKNSGGIGINIVGGDRKTLSASHNFVINNRISKFGRIFKTYQPGVRTEGVGSLIEHNSISDGPHAAIIYAGNDHHIAFNEISDVVKESGDAGAVYGGRDWSQRGNVIEMNYLHDISGFGPIGAAGVYLDDELSGITVRKNLFVRVTTAVLIGGGVDNIVENNLFVRSVPCIHMDQRGIGPGAKGLNSQLMSFLKQVPFDSPLYISRYPHLASIIADGPGTPRRNVINRNLSIQGKLDDFGRVQPEVLKLQSIGTNWTTSDAGSVFKKKVDIAVETNVNQFEVDDGSEWVKNGFEPFDLSQVGAHE